MKEPRALRRRGAARTKLDQCSHKRSGQNYCKGEKGEPPQSILPPSRDRWQESALATSCALKKDMSPPVGVGRRRDLCAVPVLTGSALTTSCGAAKNQSAAAPVVAARTPRIACSYLRRGESTWWVMGLPT